MENIPFKPTTCTCREDRQNCMEQPGHLLPGQLAEILDYLKVPLSRAAEFFWNSPGMLLGRAGRVFRIRTITPRLENGKCVFYKNERCTIHAVAPYGCRYFDVHMRSAKGQKRASWGATFIIEHATEYAAERDVLPEATSYKPRGY